MLLLEHKKNTSTSSTRPTLAQQGSIPAHLLALDHGVPNGGGVAGEHVEHAARHARPVRQLRQGKGCRGGGPEEGGRGKLGRASPARPPSKRLGAKPLVGIALGNTSPAS